MRHTMTDEDFDKLWQRAETEGYAAKLSQEYPMWRARQRRNTGMAAAIAVMLAVAIPALMPHHSGYGKVYCNRGDIAEAQWVSLTSEILMTV